jgi:microcystin degradation protein MlrC
MRKILVAGIHHESNTFNPILTGKEDFSVQRGDELFSFLNDSDSVSGIVRTLQAAGYEVVPSLVARAVPNGVVQKQLYLDLKRELLQRAEASGPYDGIALSLHGSMRVEEIGEAEGDLLRDLRVLFPTLPITASLDMHATITDAMLDGLDAFTGYKQAPHTDCFETGEHAATMLIEILEKGTLPSIAWCKLPLLIAGEKSETSVEPMHELIDLLREYETRKEVMAASYLLGFPWADCRENGVSAVVVTRNGREQAGRLAEELADAFWQRREQFKFHTVTREEDEALALACQATTEVEGPVYLSDSGDNPTAGSSADCTGFLKKVLASSCLASLKKPVVYAGIYDPAATCACFAAGLGGKVDMSVGAAFDRKTSAPLPISGKVRSLVSGWERFAADMAMVRVGHVDLILVSKHIGFITPDMFTALGCEAEDYSVVVVKLGYLTAYHKVRAKRSIMALSKGSSNELLESLPYKNLSRPIFPLDRELNYRPKAVCKEGRKRK